MFFLPQSAGKANAHRFSPPGCPGGIEAAFSLKIEHFSKPPKGGDTMAVFRIEKTRD